MLCLRPRCFASSFRCRQHVGRTLVDGHTIDCGHHLIPRYVDESGLNVVILSRLYGMMWRCMRGDRVMYVLSLGDPQRRPGVRACSYQSCPPMANVHDSFRGALAKSRRRHRVRSPDSPHKLFFLPTQCFCPFLYQTKGPSRASTRVSHCVESLLCCTVRDDWSIAPVYQTPASDASVGVSVRLASGPSPCNRAADRVRGACPCRERIDVHPPPD